MTKIVHFLKMIKFSHTIFAFPFAIVSFLIIINKTKTVFPDLIIILFIALALIFARSAAMAFNRLVDYNYDKNNPRTKDRELVLGKLSKREVILFTIVCSSCFIGVCFFINQLCFILSPFVLALLFAYSFLKRFSSFCHLYLGLVIGLTPIGVNIALNETVSMTSILLFLAVAFWILGFDIIYSLLDLDYDKKAKLKSIPVNLGNKRALLVSRLAYLSMISTLAVIGWINQFYIIYYSGLAIIGILLFLQHVWVKPEDLSKVNKAFFDLNSLISIIYLISVILELQLSN